MSEALGLLDEMRLAGLLHGATYTATIPAANLTAGTDAAQLIKLYPQSDKTGDTFLVVERISSQGLAPSNLTITADDLHRSAMRILLDANLVSDRLLMGDASKGVELTIRNNGAAAATVVIQCATMKQEAMMRILDRLGVKA